MEHIYNLTDHGDTAEQYYGVDNVTNNERIITAFDNSAILKLNQEARKTDGFNYDKSMRVVAHIEPHTVKLLALTHKDPDAIAYLTEHDTAARDRMIRNYPHLFKACSGGV